MSTLDPAPSWAAWNHGGDGLWPCLEDSAVDLNEVAGPEWIDEAGRRARDRPRAGESEAVIGHCDWLAGNLRWSGDALLAVHDWDSVIAESEAVLVGFAAALYSAASADELATVPCRPRPSRKGIGRFRTKAEQLLDGGLSMGAARRSRSAATARRC